MGIDILGLHGTKVLKPFKQIRFVFAPHQIDLLNRQGIGKFPVIREAPALPLGPQSIDAFVYIVIGSIVIAQDLLIQRQEHLVQRIGGNFTDVPPEEVVLRDLENIPHRFYGEFAILVQPQLASIRKGRVTVISRRAMRYRQLSSRFSPSPLLQVRSFSKSRAYFKRSSSSASMGS